MSTTSEITSGAVRGLTPLIVLGGALAALYLYRDQIKNWFGEKVTEPIKELPGEVTTATQQVIDQQVTSVTDLNPDTGGWLVSSMETAALWLSEKLGIDGSTESVESNVELSPITGNPIEYQPSKVSEYVATNAYLPGVTLLPENQNALWRPTNEVVGQIHDISEFTGGVDIYDIIRDASSTGKGSLYAVRHGAGLSEGGIDVSSWDRVFKKDTYTVVMF